MTSGQHRRRLRQPVRIRSRIRLLRDGPSTTAGIDPIAIGDNNRGVFEWEGWSFADRAFWSFAARAMQNSFTKASGPFAIADSDEFADLGGTNPADPPGTGDVTQPMSTVLKTPSINIAGMPAGQLVDAVRFVLAPGRNGPAGDHHGRLRQRPGRRAALGFDPASLKHGVDAGGVPNLNETVLCSSTTRPARRRRRLSFKYLNGSNNWFWAFDNIQIGALVPEPGSIALAALAAVGLASTSRRASASLDRCGLSPLLVDNLKCCPLPPRAG